MIDYFDDPISEEWLKEIKLEPRTLKGDKFKHWFLWIGACIPGAVQFFGNESLALELSQDDQDEKRYFCWLVQDYNKPGCAKSIFMRFLFNKGDFILLLEAITGEEWDPQMIVNGTLYAERHIIQLMQKSGFCLGAELRD